MAAARRDITQWESLSARTRYAPAQLLVAQSRLRRSARLNAIENPPSSSVSLRESAILNLAGICFCSSNLAVFATDKRLPKASIWGSRARAAPTLSLSQAPSSTTTPPELCAQLQEEFEIFQAPVSVHLLLSKLSNYPPNPSNPNRVTHLK